MSRLAKLQLNRCRVLVPDTIGAALGLWILPLLVIWPGSSSAPAQAQTRPASVQALEALCTSARSLPEGTEARLTLLSGGVPLVEIPELGDESEGLLHATLTFLAGERYANSDLALARYTASFLNQTLTTWIGELKTAEPDLRIQASVRAGRVTLSVSLVCPPALWPVVLEQLAGLLHTAPVFKESIPLLAPDARARLHEFGYGWKLDPATQASAQLSPERLAELVRQHQVTTLGTERLWIAIGGPQAALADAALACAQLVEQLPAGSPLPRLPDMRPFEVPKETQVLWIEQPLGSPEIWIAGPSSAADVPDSTALRARLQAESIAGLAAEEIDVTQPDWDGHGYWWVRLTPWQLPKSLTALRSTKPRAGLEAAHTGETWPRRFERARSGLDPYEPEIETGAAFDALANLQWNRFVAQAPWLVIAVGPDQPEFLDALQALGPLTRLPERGVRGDSAQAAMELERTFEALGGRARWARLATFRLDSELKLEAFDEPVRTVARQRIAPLALHQEQTLSGKTQTTVVLTKNSWTEVEGHISPSDPDRHRALVSSVRRSLPQVLQRLSVDNSLRARITAPSSPPRGSDPAPRRLEVYDASRERPVLWFELGPQQLPLRVGFSGPGDAGIAYAYDNYREIEGYVYPSRVIDLARGIETQRSFTPNPELPSELFERRRAPNDGARPATGQR